MRLETSVAATTAPLSSRTPTAASTSWPIRAGVRTPRECGAAAPSMSLMSGADLLGPQGRDRDGRLGLAVAGAVRVVAAGLRHAVEHLEPGRDAPERRVVRRQRAVAVDEEELAAVRTRSG